MVIRVLAFSIGLALALTATWLGSMFGLPAAPIFVVCLALVYFFKEDLIDIAEDAATSIFEKIIGGKNIHGE